MPEIKYKTGNVNQWPHLKQHQENMHWNLPSLDRCCRFLPSYPKSFCTEYQSVILAFRFCTSILLVRVKHSSYMYTPASTSISSQNGPLRNVIALTLTLTLDCSMAFVMYVKAFDKSALLISVRAQEYLVYEKKKCRTLCVRLKCLSLIESIFLLRG